MVHMVPVSIGDRASIRMPTEAERRARHLTGDLPVIEIQRSDGSIEIHGGVEAGVIFTPLNSEPEEPVIGD